MTGLLEDIEAYLEQKVNLATLNVLVSLCMDTSRCLMWLVMTEQSR